jgi:hypothetical protein
LAAVVRKTAADGMHQTDFDRLGLGQQQTGRAQCSTGSASLKYQSTGQLGIGSHGKSSVKGRQISEKLWKF